MVIIIVMVTISVLYPPRDAPKVEIIASKNIVPYSTLNSITCILQFYTIKSYLTHEKYFNPPDILQSVCDGTAKRILPHACKISGGLKYFSCVK